MNDHLFLDEKCLGKGPKRVHEIRFEQSLKKVPKEQIEKV